MKNQSQDITTFVFTCNQMYSLDRPTGINTWHGNIYQHKRSTIIRKANTKLSVGHHGPLTKAKVGSGAIEE
jgi:hypothetical protein